MKRILLCTLRWLLKPIHEMREYTWFRKALGGSWALTSNKGWLWFKDAQVADLMLRCASQFGGGLVVSREDWA